MMLILHKRRVFEGWAQGAHGVQDGMLDSGGRRLDAGMTPFLWRENDANEKWESVIIKILMVEASSSRSRSDPGRGTPRPGTAFQLVIVVIIEEQ